MGDSVSMATQDSATGTVCEENRRCRGCKLGKFSLFFLHMNSDVTHPTPILTETFLQLPNDKGGLSLLAAYALALRVMKEKETVVFNNELIQ